MGSSRWEEARGIFICVNIHPRESYTHGYIYAYRYVHVHVCHLETYTCMYMYTYLYKINLSSPRNIYIHTWVHTYTRISIQNKPSWLTWSAVTVSVSTTASISCTCFFGFFVVWFVCGFLCGFLCVWFLLVCFFRLDLLHLLFRVLCICVLFFCVVCVFLCVLCVCLCVFFLFFVGFISTVSLDVGRSDQSRGGERLSPVPVRGLCGAHDIYRHTLSHPPPRPYIHIKFTHVPS